MQPLFWKAFTGLEPIILNPMILIRGAILKVIFIEEESLLEDIETMVFLYIGITQVSLKS